MAVSRYIYGWQGKANFHQTLAVGSPEPQLRRAAGQHIGVILGLYQGYVGVILGLYKGHIRVI